jgi:hypothetical protein
MPGQEPPPTFRYHPDPIATSCVEPSDTVCRARGYFYSGPIYGHERLHDQASPWRTADGTAHTKFGSSFADVRSPSE